MGRTIDRLALSALAAIGYYLFFLNAWGSIPLACALAFACCLLTERVARGGRWRRLLPRRASSAQAGEALSRIAGMEDGAAQALLGELVRWRYPGEDFALAAVLKHPEASLSCGDVLGAWKANRGAERLVIAATCPCEPRAAVYARELAGPAVAVLDSRALIRRLRRRDPVAAPAPPPLKARLRRAIARLAARRVSPGSGLLGAALVGLYFIGGNPFNLFAGLALLGRLGVALIQRHTGRRLFDA